MPDEDTSEKSALIFLPRDGTYHLYRVWRAGREAQRTECQQGAAENRRSRERARRFQEIKGFPDEQRPG